MHARNPSAINTSVVSLALLLLSLAHAAGAQVLPNSSSYFPMIGLTRGQTLQVNLVAYPPDPCFAQMGFLNSEGILVGPVNNVTLQPGQSASLSINGNMVAATFGQRVELMPRIVVNPNSVSACHATAEVFDTLLGTTTVLAVGAQGFPPSPAFGLLHLSVFQTARLNISAYPPDPCDATIGFVDGNGALVGNSLKTVQLGAGQATFLDLQGLTLVNELGQRASVRPIVTPTSSIPGTSAPAHSVCTVSAEIYDNFDGATDVIFPPDPCDPATGSCAVP
jgi:hypothetical protein